MFLVDLSQRFLQLLVSRGIVEVSAYVSDAANKPFPQIRVDRAGGELFEVFRDFFARIIVTHGGTPHADHGELARQQLLAGEIVESGNQLAARQVSGKTEDHHHARICDASGSLFGWYWPCVG